MITIDEVKRSYSKQKMLQLLFQSIIDRNNDKACEYVSSKITKYNRYLYELYSMCNGSLANYDYLSKILRDDFIKSLNFSVVLTKKEKSYLTNYIIGRRKHLLKKDMHE